MTLKDRSLHLDLTQNEAELRILPAAISSNKVNWQNITIKHFQTSAWEIAEHSHPHHELLVHLNSTAQVERNIDSQSKQENITNGDIAIVPAGANHKSLWQDKNEFMVLTLPPKLVEWYAWDLLDPDRVELLPQFAQKDALIHSLTLNLKAEIESNSDRLYAETLTSTL